MMTLTSLFGDVLSSGQKPRFQPQANPDYPRFQQQSSKQVQVFLPALRPRSPQQLPMMNPALRTKQYQLVHLPLASLEHLQ